MDTKQIEVLAPELLTHKQYVYVMTLFYLQHAQGQLSENDFFMLIDSLRAEDLEGARWTYHPLFGKWLCVDGEEWTEGMPRGPLLVALPASVVDELNDCLKELEEIEERVTPEPEQPADIAEGVLTSCPACGAKQPPGSRFCNQCGAAIPEPEPTEPQAPSTCIECGAELVPGSRFCNICGAEQLAPAATEAAQPVIEPEPEARAQAFCTGCGQRLKPGAAFCSKCGKPVK